MSLKSKVQSPKSGGRAPWESDRPALEITPAGREALLRVEIETLHRRIAELRARMDALEQRESKPTKKKGTK